MAVELQRIAGAVRVEGQLVPFKDGEPLPDPPEVELEEGLASVE